MVFISGNLGFAREINFSIVSVSKSSSVVSDGSISQVLPDFSRRNE